MAPHYQSIINNRLLAILVCQSISSSIIFILYKLIIIVPLSFVSPTLSFVSLTTSFHTHVFTFMLFHIFHLAYAFSISIVAPTRPHWFHQLRLSPFDRRRNVDFWRRALLNLRLGMFVVMASVLGFLSMVCVCCIDEYVEQFQIILIWRVGFRGCLGGVIYGLVYLYREAWVLDFDILERPPFSRLKHYIPQVIREGMLFSIAAVAVAFIPSFFVCLKVPYEATFIMFRINSLIIYTGFFAVFLCWEVDRHLYQVLLTRRLIFAPPEGTAAAVIDPSEPLLAALEESASGSLLQYLAYLDLYMVCETKVDTWRRAAFFKDTSVTYRRVIALCMRPLEELATELLLPTGLHVDSNSSKPLENFQLYVWCARSSASLTAHSCKEDWLGIAKRYGSNAAVMSTLLSCLLAVEAFMGKAPAGIRWAALSSRRGRDVGMGEADREGEKD